MASNSSILAVNNEWGENYPDYHLYMKAVNIFLLLLSALLVQGCTAIQSKERKISRKFYENKMEEFTQKALAYLSDMPQDSATIPRSAFKDGSLNGTVSRSWTSGFYPGELWMLYGYSGDEQFKEAATTWTHFLDKEKFDTHTHDLGFKLNCSYGQAYKHTKNEAYKDVVLQASETLIKRYNPTVGCIRSWDFNKEVWQFPVIIDNMMNLEMLFEATRLSGDSTFYMVAYQHALTTLKNHIRPDNSSYHVIDYDTLSGRVRNRHTHQGQSHESAWARGQAWSLYGFAMAYRETKDVRFLNHAKAVANFMYKHPNMPIHGVPYWDFDAHNIPNELLDASAAAVAASGLLILCEVDSNCKKEMLPWADTSLKTLCGKEFRTDISPFLLGHSVGSIPGDFEVDVPIIYADYYFIEALTRRLKLETEKGKALTAKL